MTDATPAGPSTFDVEQALKLNALRVGDWVKVNNGLGTTFVWDITHPGTIKMLRNTNIFDIEEIRREAI